MKSLPKHIEEAYGLFAKVVDEQLTKIEAKRLEDLVTGDVEIRKLYVEYMHTHSCIHWEQTNAVAPSIKDLVDATEEGSNQRVSWNSEKRISVGSAVSAFNWKDVFRLLVGSFAVLAVGAWMGSRWELTPELPVSGSTGGLRNVVAVLTQTVGCRWQGSRLPTLSGSQLEPGNLRLTGGLATITFRSGAEIVLEGPAEIDLITPMRCFLRSGKLVAKVPPEAKGFTVVTEHADLIDQGTEFGVSVSPSGALGMSVIDGLVEVRHQRSGVLKQIRDGESSVISEAGVATDGVVLFEGWGTEVMPDLRRDDTQTVTVSTAFGRGRDAYIQSGNPEKYLEAERHNSESLLLVKNSLDEDWTRKAYLGFDLSPLSDYHVVEAVLNLTIESSGFGYASLVPDATFGVYGLTEETLDEWLESELDWDSAPSNLPGGAEVDLNRTVRIGEFIVIQGELAGSCEVSGRQLIDFLNEDTNQLATFIIVRETLESKVGSIVHAFAGKDHLTSAAPTLRMTVEPIVPK